TGADPNTPLDGHWWRSARPTITLFSSLLELERVSLEDRNAADTSLRKAGFDVLWITHHCGWLDKAHGVGINAYLEPPELVRTTEVGNVHISVDEGLMAAGPVGLNRRPAP
ncbi:hypothetical protein, partial [Arthrobacter celericrescens]|uniref:hypothetical protein n=1 Tax=Arthrobacter celericrescens TaxID=2320851 RepID=UPI0019699A0A